METRKYKILVLSDLKKSAGNVLKSTVSLAKMIHGDIELFHVKKPIEILEKDNQLSAMRTITTEYKTTEKEIQNLIAPISKNYGVHINYNFVFGNVKAEIEKYIKEQQPDIVVLGKKASISLSVIGDRVTPFVLKKHKGVIMIANEKKLLDPNKQLVLGLLNGTDASFKMDFSEDLLGHSKKPIKSFKIVKNTDHTNETNTASSTKTIEYVFEQNDNAFNNISNYLVKNNINLLCIDRSKNPSNNETQKQSDIKDAINKLNVSLLLTGGQKQRLQY